MAKRGVMGPTMSDTTLLVTVEDLINRALGPENTNQVDFKLLQAILQIFARQQRLLQQRVQLRFSERLPTKAKKKKEKKPKGSQARGAAAVEFDDDDDDDDDISKITTVDDRSPETEKITEQDTTDKADDEDKKGKKKVVKRSKGGTKKSEKDKDLGKGGKVQSGLEISETVRDKEKVLVVDRGPQSPRSPKTPRDDRSESPRHEGPINVVTQEQFATVEASLQELQGVAASSLRLSEYQQRDDVAGAAKRLNARVKSTEETVGHLVDMLCELADSGALPRELRAAMKKIRFEPEGRGSEYRRHRSSSTMSASPRVTREELDEFLSDAMSELTRTVNDATLRAAESADWALRKAQAVGEKMERASSLNVRLSTLQTLVEDYFEQVGGFETGLTTQIRQFQEQIEQIDTDLTAGLEQLKQVNNNTETAAVIALTERYDDLVLQMEATVNDNQAIASGQGRLGREIQNLAQALENLKEQKCDRAEVVDGLRDKATTSQLKGLLGVEHFECVRDDLDSRLSSFHDKFHEQENAWMEALKDLSDRADRKAQFLDLLRARDEVQDQLREVDERLRLLAIAIGEPEVAFLKRQLLADMQCASCREPALLQARTTAARAPPDHHERTSKSDGESDSPRKHMCRRWCGGSHTLLSHSVTRERAPPRPATAAVRRYTDYGDDGRLYMMQEECRPCLECNKLDPTTSFQSGRGDGDYRK